MKKSLLKKKLLKRQNRKYRTRAKIEGTSQRPRLSVYRSIKHIYVQIIDDNRMISLVSANDKELDKKSIKKISTSATGKIKNKEFIAKEVGKLIAQKALAKKINQVVFDRGRLAYHGRIKALAEGARAAGLKF